MVAAAVQTSLAMKIYQVDEQLLADTADKASGMPDGVGTETCRQYNNVSLSRLLLTLKEDEESERIEIRERPVNDYN